MDRYLQFIEEIKAITVAQYSAKIKAELLEGIKSADDGVHDAFWPQAPRATYATSYEKNILSELSVKYAAFAISCITDYGFNNTVSLNYGHIAPWFKANNKSIGPILFKRILCSMNLDYCHNDINVWNDFLSAVKKNTFIIGLNVEVLSSSQWVLSMLLGAIEAFDKNAAPDVINVSDTYQRRHYGETVLHWILSDNGPGRYNIQTNGAVNNT